jgi:hypothetical protein
MTRNMSNTIGVNTSKEFTLDNPSNATQEIGLDMDIQLTGCDSIEIKNITTGKTFKLENLPTDDYKNLKLYGDLQYIKSKTNDSLNVFGKVTKEQWIKLVKGENLFLVTSGNAIITFNYKCKIQFM